MSAAKKLTITIPDGLAERIEPFRDRLNLSAIAANAIERAVEDEVTQQALHYMLFDLSGTLDALREWHAACMKCGGYVLPEEEQARTEAPLYKQIEMSMFFAGNEDRDEFTERMFSELIALAVKQFGPIPE